MAEKPKRQDRDASKAQDELERTVTLATAALDHPDLSDEELERLCDIALSEGADVKKDNSA